MAITDKIYLKNHRHIASQLDTSIPKRAFAGATLDLLFQGEGMSKLDTATRERVLAFSEDFLDCRCESNPFCGCPERKFIRYLLELRREGHSPESIIDIMSEEYLVYAYPGDILTFLDDSVRTLEAIEALAEVESRDATAEAAAHRKFELSG